MPCESNFDFEDDLDEYFEFPPERGRVGKDDDDGFVRLWDGGGEEREEEGRWVDAVDFEG